MGIPAVILTASAMQVQAAAGATAAPAADAPARAQRPSRSVCAGIIAFVHMPKCGGTGMYMSLTECCKKQMLPENVHRDHQPRRLKLGLRSMLFHATAHEQRYIAGPSLWAWAYSFALVRNPWARHVSFFFQAATDLCRPRNGVPLRPRTQFVCDTIRLMPAQSVYVTKPEKDLGPTEFQRYVREQFKAWPPGSELEWRFSQIKNRTRGGMFPTLRKATQWSWIADEHGKLMVTEWFRLEELKQNWPRLQRRICGLRSVDYEVHATRGRGNCAGPGRQCAEPAVQRRYQDFYDARTKAIVAQVMDDDVKHFGYSFG
eukprot:TRINITY_DN70385_c0_g1_i1.p1 TRINITY_DN70385_c0_g1~~TRINITY_DN70385_c0_g1_i1.p1  ORF type:complete len:316 (+),score=50.38 TRINITY_DN70385_c0_g1_i1:84-1031(+)